MYRLLSLSWALIIGLMVRVLHRIAGQTPRIVHGIYPMHMTRSMVQAGRCAGFPSTAIVTHTRLAPYDLVTDADFEVVLSDPQSEDSTHWRAAAYLFRHADIWVTYFDSVFSAIAETPRDDLLFRLMRLAGIRIVAIANGLDVTYVDRGARRFDWVHFIEKDYPDWNLAGETARRMKRNERFCRRASLVIADPQTRRFLTRTDLSFKYFPIEVTLPDSTAQTAEAPTVVHAPNHRWIKGTSHLLRALKWLEDRDVRANLDLVEKTRRREAISRYSLADIAADQFLTGAYGVFALESLALGKPVLCYLDEDHLGNPAFDLPLVNANPDNLPFALAPLIRIPELRRRIGDAGREQVTRYHSVDAMAEVFKQIYDHVWWGAPLHLDDTRHFGRERKPRAFTENPAQAEYWPVPVDDLIDEIRSVLVEIGMSPSDFTRTRLPRKLWEETSVSGS